MPQFELEEVGPDRFTGLARGLDLEDAVRRATGVADGVAVSTRVAADPGAWQSVRIAGADSGRARLHQRMRFRRD